jgi:hypothetical protein
VGLAFVLAALLLYVGGNQFLTRGSFQSAAFLTINLGFGYWYWLPAIPLLFSPTSDILYAAQISPEAIPSAAWTVLLYHFLTVMIFLICRDLFDKRPFVSQYPLPIVGIAIVTAISSLTCFLVQFRDLGIGQMIGILTARSSAREVMTYFNHSASALESLMSLWQILNLSFAVFVMATAVVRRDLANVATAAAGFAVALNFLGSGTRTILLMALTAVLLSWLMRPTGVLRAWQKTIASSKFRFLYLMVLAGVGVVSFYGVAARFASNDGNTSYVSDSVINNNDMMRELAFVQQNMAGYVAPSQWNEAINFVRTPFNTLMPSFLGFDKAIPYHLIVYNFQRAGIDLENGQGNVFPGLIADYYLVFGSMGALIFVIEMLLFLLVVQLCGSVIRDGTARGGFYASILVLIFVSFRNIQGSLAMVIIAIAMVIWLVEQRRSAPLGSGLIGHS